MKRILMNIALAASILLLFSCNQSPLFYNISKETPPKDPVVAGTPSKLVYFTISGKLYVANGRVWEYDGSTWKQTAGQPSGDFKEVAATTGTGAALYALSVEGTGSTSTKLWKSIDGTTWTLVTNNTGYPILGGIFGASDTLFAGARNSDTSQAAVLYDDSGTLMTALGPVAISDAVPGTLVGAVQMGGNYYLAVSGKGVYAAGTVNGFGTSAITGTTDTKYKLNGLIALNSQVVAVGSGGYMIAENSGSFSEVSGASDTSYPYTGALAVWTDPNNSANQLLLAGRRYSTYTNGYWEVTLSSGDLPGTVTMNKPGAGSLTTVADTATYEQSLGQKVITALYQAPGVALGSTLFASTLKDGLWAYRNNAWNAEE
ncbi:MAG: hypothetical protein GX438_07140 [Treponema sp.]|nr:hypothetical protein [Treponema sp.]